jgi:Protein of unknown function (DUF3160)
VRPGKYVLLFAGVALAVAAAGALYLAKRKSASTSTRGAGNSSSAETRATPQVKPQGTGQGSQYRNIAETTTSFLGTLTPGGAPESAGRERKYMVTYQVAFLRKAPTEKLPEESLSYQELQNRDPYSLPPHVFYGESVFGTYDPAHPESIAIRTTIDNKEVRGYVDAQKLWLEPSLAAVDTPQYMTLKDGTAVHVVPDTSSPTVLSLLQGEVVEAVGKLDFQGVQWIKAHFNGTETPRYGFLQASDMQALTVATVNQSAVSVEEIPRQIRDRTISLTEADRQKLSQNGFYIESVPPAKEIFVDDMADAYRYERPQYFITSDLFLHAHHLIFDRMLQDVEEKKLFPSVSKLAANLAHATENEIKTLPAATPADVQEALTYDLFYFSVAAELLDPSFTAPDPLGVDTQAFVSQIQKAGGELPSAKSSKFGDEDFTQYKVRGHYEKNETLQRYFRAMMWFGRRDFPLADRKMTLAAILIPGLADKAQETSACESIDSSLEYLVGPQDKYTLAEYRSVNKKVFGTETPDATQVAAKLDDNLQAFNHAVESDLPPPQIVSVQTGTGKTQEERLKMVRGFKFLGQRYTLDAFLLNQMTSPSVGTNRNPRNLPSTLDVMMILGSQAAAEQQQQEQQRQKWANYDSQAKKLQGVAQEHLAKQATFYDEWLNSLNSLFLPVSSKQLFALGKPWQYKNLNAGAASWTELKHDTILYAEESSAENGGGEEFEIPAYSPPSPKGYIEPNPAFFRSLGQCIDQMLNRMKSTDFITDEYLDKFTALRELAGKAEAIAQKEVSGAPITEEDYDWIGSLVEEFDRPLLLPRGVDEIRDPSELQMALIADVATDAVGGRVLEIATGTPQRITVVVKDAYGGTRLTVGSVYSWYEFPGSKRWADSEWKKVIYTEDPEARKQNGVQPPSWYSIFMKNSGGPN